MALVADVGLFLIFNLVEAVVGAPWCLMLDAESFATPIVLLAENLVLRRTAVFSNSSIWALLKLAGKVGRLSILRPSVLMASLNLLLLAIFAFLFDISVFDVVLDAVAAHAVFHLTTEPTA